MKEKKGWLSYEGDNASEINQHISQRIFCCNFMGDKNPTIKTHIKHIQYTVVTGSGYGVNVCSTTELGSATVEMQLCSLSTVQVPYSSSPILFSSPKIPSSLRKSQFDDEGKGIMARQWLEAGKPLMLLICNLKVSPRDVGIALMYRVVLFVPVQAIAVTLQFELLGTWATLS